MPPADAVAPPPTIDHVACGAPKQDARNVADTCSPIAHQTASIPPPSPHAVAPHQPVQPGNVQTTTATAGSEPNAGTRSAETGDTLSTEPAAAAPIPPPDENIIVVTGREDHAPGDPVEMINVKTFQAVQAVDDAIVAPVAHGYERGVPRPIRDGVSNVINNLDEPIVFVNFLLQFKIGKAFETLGRFAVNSTIGVAGLVDVAKRKPFNLPRRPNGLADTLGYYGIGPGPYLFLPLIGATTVRDMFGRIVDLSLVPAAVGKPLNQPAFALTKGTLSSITERVELDDELRRVKESEDPYVAMREYYLDRRKAEIMALHSQKYRDKKAMEAGQASETGEARPDDVREPLANSVPAPVAAPPQTKLPTQKSTELSAPMPDLPSDPVSTIEPVPTSASADPPAS